MGKEKKRKEKEIRMVKLQKFKSLRESIAKIKILKIELKIAPNFRSGGKVYFKVIVFIVAPVNLY